MGSTNWTTVVIAVISAVIVAVLTQVFETSRHSDLRRDKEAERIHSDWAASQRRQLEAVSNFCRTIRELSSTRNEQWAKSVIEIQDDHHLRVDGGIKNVTFFLEVDTALDLLSLEITDYAVQECIPALRKAAESLRYDPVPFKDEKPRTVPYLPLFDGNFAEAQQRLITVARERLNPVPRRPFEPLFVEK